jgi:hypothetical protein
MEYTDLYFPDFEMGKDKNVLKLITDNYGEVEKQGDSRRNPRKYSAVAHTSGSTNLSLLLSLLIFSL